MVKGIEVLDFVIVIFVYYDYVGEWGGEVYNGVDDNVLGVGVFLELVRYFQAKFMFYSFFFVVWDVEEIGFWGVNYFVYELIVLLENIILNINMDMIGCNVKE